MLLSKTLVSTSLFLKVRECIRVLCSYLAVIEYVFIALDENLRLNRGHPKKYSLASS